MRLKPGAITEVAQESITSKLLLDVGIVEPDFFPTIMGMKPNITPLMSILDFKGYKTSGLNYGTNWLVDGGRYKTVSSNHVQYLIATTDMRKEHFRTNLDGVTFYDPVSSTYPGQEKRAFYIYLDSNWIGMNDVAILADGKTQLFFLSDGTAANGGVWQYRVKIDGNNEQEYVETYLMSDGIELMLASTKFRHDFSVGGNERHTFGGIGDAYLTLQRFKYSWSGTAAAMDKNSAGKKVTGRWVTNGTGKLQSFLTKAQEDMMDFAAKSLEFQLLEGKGTVSNTTGKVVLTDDQNQDIMSGSGVMYSGDGPIEFPINSGWSEKVIEAMLTDIDSYITADESGSREAVAILHPKSYFNLQSVLSKMRITSDSNIEGSGGEKVINNTYKGYEIGGVRLYFVRSDYYGGRPGVTLKDGTKSNEWDGVIVPMGKTTGGARGIELIQLRPMVKGKVAGIDAGGNIATEVDGSSEHVLLQNGIICQARPIFLYRPWKNNLI